MGTTATCRTGLRAWVALASNPATTHRLAWFAWVESADGCAWQVEGRTICGERVDMGRSAIVATFGRALVDAADDTTHLLADTTICATCSPGSGPMGPQTGSARFGLSPAMLSGEGGYTSAQVEYRLLAHAAEVSIAIGVGTDGRPFVESLDVSSYYPGRGVPPKVLRATPRFVDLAVAGALWPAGRSVEFPLMATTPEQASRAQGKIGGHRRRAEWESARRAELLSRGRRIEALIDPGQPGGGLSQKAAALRLGMTWGALRTTLYRYRAMVSPE